MKISKKDRNLLILLGIILIFAAYYMFLLKPMEEKIIAVENEIDLAEASQLELRGKLSSEKQIDENILKLQRELISLSESYYTELGHEEILIIVSDIVKELNLTLDQFSFETRNFSENTENPENTDDITYSVSINFTGDYKDVLTLLREVRQHPKKIFPRELSVATEGELIKGKFILEFNVLSSLESFSKEWLHYVKAVPNTRDVTLSPFTPFPEFIVAQEAEEPVFVDESPENPDESFDYENYRPKSTIYSFEDGAYFFVGNTSEIQGLLTRSKTKTEGGYSASMEFDFGSAREFSESSLVFDTDTIVLNRQPESIGLWMYAHEASNHNVGVEVMDAVGKSHKIELARGIDFTQWKELEAKMPFDITYPCKVVRLYVEGVGYSQKLTGQYLFDQLQVIYPVE